MTTHEKRYYNGKKEKVREIPEEFNTCEDAAGFWETHDSTEYDDVLEEVEMEVDIDKRHYLVEIDRDISEVLHRNARKKGVTDSALASSLLREELVKMK